MKDLILKYNLLDSFSKKEINDFLDFLLRKNKKMPEKPASDYKKKLLKVSTWSEKDIKVLNEGAKMLGQWNAREW